MPHWWYPAARGYVFGELHNEVKSDCMQLYTSSGDEQKPTEIGAPQLKSHHWETFISDVLVAGLFTSVFMNSIHIPFKFMFS